MDDTQFASVGVSQRKARTAERLGRETHTFYNLYEAGRHYLQTLDPTLVALPGGFPLIEGGRIIGALGCSCGDQNASVCGAGAASVK